MNKKFLSFLVIVELLPWLFATIPYAPANAELADIYGDHLNARILDVADGLSLNTPMAVVQDDEGFVWIGTQSGLNRYDGYEFVHYFRDEKPRSLPHGHIRTFLVDSESRLWIGTLDGLSIYQRETDDFLSVPIDGAHRGHQVRSLLQDSSNGIWVGSSEGLYRGSHKSVVPYANPSSDLEFGMVVGLYEDTKKRLWIGTLDRGIYVLASDGNMESIVDWKHSGLDAPPRDIRHFHEDQEGKIWASSLTDAVLVLDFDRKSVDRISEISTYGVRAVQRRKNGDLLVGGRGGLIRWNGGLEIVRAKRKLISSTLL